MAASPATLDKSHVTASGRSSIIAVGDFKIVNITETVTAVATASQRSCYLQHNEIYTLKANVPKNAIIPAMSFEELRTYTLHAKNKCTMPPVSPCKVRSVIVYHDK